MTFTLRWGILAPGGIAEDFVRDLLLDPASRNVSDVKHEVVAIASRSGTEKANDFVKRIIGGSNTSIKTYGSYEGLNTDANVDIVYVATPQSHHYDNVKSLLSAGKNVLCEKPFVINAKQAEILVNLAKQKNVFLMEARWTKFFDLVQQIRSHLFQKNTIGNIRRVFADFGQYVPEDHRLYNANLGGGALLDLGVYPLTFISIILREHPNGDPTSIPKITSQIMFDKKGCVDEETAVILNFEKIRVPAVLTTGLRANCPDAHRVLIQGDKGDITVAGPSTSQPTSYTIEVKGQQPQHIDVKIPGWGMMWEADECARCIQGGKLESTEVSHAESIWTMKVFDQVRKQNNFRFPEEIEKY